MKTINKLKKIFFDQIAQPIITKKDYLKKYPFYDFFSFGSKNPNKIFYVIKRTPGAGLFSNLIFVVNHLEIANKHKFIPIIDMENYPTIYNEEKPIDGTSNAWLYYFNQVSKYTLDEVYKSKNVIITKNQFYKVFDHAVYKKKSLLELSNKIIINKSIIIKLNKFLKNTTFNKYKTLGIHYRGTSYKDAANHPFPPTYTQLVKKIDKLLIKHNYHKIFFSTEDKGMFDQIINKYSDKIIYYNSFRSIKDDAFKKYPRKNHRYKLGEEILIESLILSKCHTFLFVETNVSSFVRFLKNKNQILIPLKNGFNSSNAFIAKWLWYIKKLLPKNLGGFD